MNKWRQSFGILLIGAALALPGTSTARADETVTIFAAASLHAVLDELSRQTPTGIKLRVSTAGSGTIAKQVAAGAPADIFISANEEWADWLATEGHLKQETLRPLATNRLVLATRSRSKLPDLDVADLLTHKKVRRIAIGETATVPAGIYGREVLVKMGMWSELKPKLLPAESVRSVVRWVERGEADIGFVYESDITGSKGLRPLHLFDAESSPPITPASYIAAIVRGKDRPSVKSVYDQLFAAPAQKSLAEHGFQPIQQAPTLSPSE